jgi:hypothetical protein
MKRLWLARMRAISIRRFLDEYRLAHYLIGGAFFTLLGPSVFWLLYPAGPLVAALLTEISCHTIRYLCFKHFIYPVNKGFRVTVLRYIGSVIPVSLLGLTAITILSSYLNRLQLTAMLLTMSIALGIIINSFTYGSKFCPRICRKIRLFPDRDQQ